MSYFQKMMLVIIIIMPISITIIRGVPELLLGLNITSTMHDIIMFLLIIKLAVICNKWVYEDSKK